jgi:hypothetical protein
MNCPLPRYYLCHAVIALIIAAVLAVFIGLTAGLAAGTAFYAGREFTQWESGLPFDWKGLLAPFTACLIILLAYRLL